MIPVVVLLRDDTDGADDAGAADDVAVQGQLMGGGEDDRKGQGGVRQNIFRLMTGLFDCLFYGLDGILCGLLLVQGDGVVDVPGEGFLQGGLHP